MIRILTAAALIGVLAATLWLPPYAFVIVLAGFVAAAWSEFAALAAAAGATPLRGLGAPLAMGVAGSFAAVDPATPIVVAGLAMLASAAAGLAAGRQHPTLAVRRAAATVGGLCWLGIFPGAYVALRFHDDGALLIALAVAAVSAGDIGAYYGGRLFGRHALSPNLSPHKTIEGALFGLVASGVGGALVSHYGLPSTPWTAGLGLGVCLGAVGQAGDLFESALKRAAGSKDSSTLLPGHGGVLDRIDGLLFAGPVMHAAVFFGLL